MKLPYHVEMTVELKLSQKAECILLLANLPLSRK